MIRHRVLCVLVGVCLLLAGCFDRGLPEGVVATVNGEPIYLRTLQTMMDGVSTSLGTQTEPSLDKMQVEYAEAVRTLIVQTLVRQELNLLGMSISEENIEKEIDDIRKDYDGNGLNAYLAEESISENEWKLLIADNLAMSHFEKRVILPRIHITLQMVKSYYDSHMDQFKLPDVVSVCFVSGDEKEKVQEFAEKFTVDMKSQLGQVSAACMESSISDIPKVWTKQLQTIQPGACTTVSKRDKIWETVCLKSRVDPEVMHIVKAYPIIESLLLEQKKEETFNTWVEKAIAKSVIKISPLLKLPESFEDAKARPSGSEATAQEAGNGTVFDVEKAAADQEQPKP